MAMKNGLIRSLVINVTAMRSPLGTLMVGSLASPPAAGADPMPMLDSGDDAALLDALLDDPAVESLPHPEIRTAVAVTAANSASPCDPRFLVMVFLPSSSQPNPAVPRAEMGICLRAGKPFR
jgi:hypothetical protein